MPVFNIAFHGYDPDEVSEYIDNICYEYHQLAKYCMKCEAKIKELEANTAADRENLPPDAAFTGDHDPDTSRDHDPKHSSLKQIRKMWESRTAGFIFYSVLIVVVLVLFISFNESNGVPRSIFGLSAMTVLTSSMQNEIPKDSLIITKQVDAATLEIGDDITFLVNEKTTMTHRIVGIYENHLNTGMRGFETKGTMNASSDREIVSAQNIVGKVIFHNLILGKAMGFMKEYAFWICIFAPLAVGLYFALRIALFGRA